MSTFYCKEHGLFTDPVCPKCGKAGIVAPLQMSGESPYSRKTRHTIEDQFQRYLIGSLGEEITRNLSKDEVGVMREFFFAGYRVCYEAVQCALILPPAGVERVFKAMVEDLHEHYPHSSRISHGEDAEGQS